MYIKDYASIYKSLDSISYEHKNVVTVYDRQEQIQEMMFIKFTINISHDNSLSQTINLPIANPCNNSNYKLLE